MFNKSLFGIMITSGLVALSLVMTGSLFLGVFLGFLLLSIFGFVWLLFRDKRISPSIMAGFMLLFLGVPVLVWMLNISGPVPEFFPALCFAPGVIVLGWGILSQFFLGYFETEEAID
ncbi:hypothetical protein JD969_13325 [Planctomycetota bacterium]|nr:hypothetical protein JD969_13325 [Planctomycetota bacterium]